MSKKDLPFPEVYKKNSIVLFDENITRAEIKKKAEDTIESVNEGHVSAIDTYLHVRAIKEVCDAVEKGIKNTVVDSIDGLHKDEREMRGVRFELTNGRTTYGFSHDDTWNELQEQLTELKDKIKKHEKAMIDAIEYSEVYDDDGVQVEKATVTGGRDRILKMLIPKE